LAVASIAKFATIRNGLLEDFNRTPTDFTPTPGLVLDGDMPEDRDDVEMSDV
jgi:hypothetical protein